MIGPYCDPPGTNPCPLSVAPNQLWGLLLSKGGSITWADDPWAKLLGSLRIFGFRIRFRASLLWFCSEATFDANNHSYCSLSLLKQRGAALVCCRGRNSNRMSHKHESDEKVLLLQCKWCISPCRMYSRWRCKIQLIRYQALGCTPHYLCIGWSFLSRLDAPYCLAKQSGVRSKSLWNQRKQRFRQCQLGGWSQ